MTDAMHSFKFPQGNIFYRELSQGRPMISHGEGVYLFDSNGRRYLDGSGGAMVVNVGHGRHEISEAIAEQARRVSYVHASNFTSQPLETYARELAQIVPISDPRFFFVSSGSEAVEGAIKLARQIQISRGHPSRHRVLSHSMSYHGTTLGALSVTGRPAPRLTYGGLMLDSAHIPSPYPYRHAIEADELAAVLEAKIQALGAQNIAAYIAEPISGASLGAAEPPPSYWPLARQICDKYGLLLIADEVLVGMGRTGKWWAMEHWSTIPDILVTSKGVTSGYFPLGFIAVTSSEVEKIRTELGDFNHGGTFSHHVVGAAAGLATLRILRDEDLIKQSAERGSVLGQKLGHALGDHPHVGDIRGRGLFWALELVSDRKHRRPFVAGEQVARKVAKTAFELGLIVYTMQGCANGRDGDLILLGPPFSIGETQLNELVQLLVDALATVFET